MIDCIRSAVLGGEVRGDIMAHADNEDTSTHHDVFSSQMAEESEYEGGYCSFSLSYYPEPLLQFQLELSLQRYA